MAHLTEPRHVEGLGKRYHRHGRLHPQLEGNGPIGILGIDFLFHPNYSIFVQFQSQYSNRSVLALILIYIDAGFACWNETTLLHHPA